MGMPMLMRTARLRAETAGTWGGLTVNVAFMVAVRRKSHEDHWCGHQLLQRSMKYKQLARATDKLYVIAEDLSHGIMVPPSTDAA